MRCLPTSVRRCSCDELCRPRARRAVALRAVLVGRSEEGPCSRAIAIVATQSRCSSPADHSYVANSIVRSKAVERTKAIVDRCELSAQRATLAAGGACLRDNESGTTRAIHMEVADRPSAGEVGACGSPSRSRAISASSLGWHGQLAQTYCMKPPHISAGEHKRGPQQRAGALVLDVAASELATGVSTE